MRNPYATNMPMNKAGTYDPSVKSNELGAGLGGGSFLGIGGGAGEMLRGFLGGSLDEDGVKGGSFFTILPIEGYEDNRFFSPSYIAQVGLRGNHLQMVEGERTNPRHIYIQFPNFNNSVYKVITPDGQPLLSSSEEGVLVIKRIRRVMDTLSQDRQTTRGSGLAGGKLKKGSVDFDKIKKGKLKFMLGRPDSYKFSKEELEKINVDEGQMFEYNGKKRKMTPLLKKRIQFAINFMK